VILVDSSVWIDWLRGADTAAVRFIRERESSDELAVTHMIYLEVLQGLRSERQFNTVREVLGAQLILEPTHGLDTFAAAAQLYRHARAAGLTIRKSTDCLIAAIAIEQGVLLVHNDRDFFALAAATPELLIYPERKN
jgi:predicted nucleic acid-binding protein